MKHDQQPSSVVSSRLVRLVSAWWTIMRWDWRPGHLKRLLIEWVLLLVGAIGSALGFIFYPLFLVWKLIMVPVIVATRIHPDDLATANRIMEERRKVKANDLAHTQKGRERGPDNTQD